jgi:hypothetical protein
MLNTVALAGPAIASFFLCAVLLAVPFTTVADAHPPVAPPGKPPSDEYTTTAKYVATFYPLWFTWRQAQNTNRFIGPERVSPLYHAVVAVNDDTVYCSSYLNLIDSNGQQQPVIMTVPTTVSPDTCSNDTSVTYSALVMDPYGDVFVDLLPHGSPPISGGRYALTGPDYMGQPPLPPEVIPVSVPVNYPTVIFRIDKYHAFEALEYENQIHQADLFRLSLQVQTLSDYLDCPYRGHTQILPEIAFSVPYKTDADTEIANDPIAFLHELQTAVAFERNQPLSQYEQQLSDEFNQLFGDGVFGKKSDFARGAQAAHSGIVNNYLTHVDPPAAGNYWVHFTNIGDWNDQELSDAFDRSSITEFCQYCNDISAAAYYHAFRDGEGRPLKGDNPHGYVLTFPPPSGLGVYPGPEAERFWSLTAYTPDAIELVPNPINKYEVASYTGALLNPDGSLSVFLATERPDGVPIENWLPVPSGPFNIMLRVYGVVPNSSVQENTYVPPAIDSRH